MGSKWLKWGAGTLGVLGLATNFGFHHQNYLKSFFQTQQLAIEDPDVNFDLPVDFEKQIDSFCEEIEKGLPKYKKRVYESGIEAQGDFKFKKDSDRPEGSGVISSPNQGFKMIGKFSDGQLEGMGVVVDGKNNVMYKGFMENGSINGLGILNIANEFVYKGNFEKSKPKGSGKYFFKDGRECVIKGAEKPDEKKFAVCYDENKKLKYKGEWEDGNFNGKGAFFFSDGARYEGDFQSGQMHGYGHLYDKYGDLQYKGKFKEDERLGIINYYSEPIIIGGIVLAYLVTRRYIRKIPTQSK